MDTRSVITEKKQMDYSQWKTAIQAETLPTAIIDMDALDVNINRLIEMSIPSQKSIRIATKSIRIPEIIAYILQKNKIFKGVMCYTAKEAVFLSKQGIDDILIAYPVVQPAELILLRELHDEGINIKSVIDCQFHLECLANTMLGAKRPFPVLIDMDMSLRYLNGLVHLGARRSPVRTLEDLKNILLLSVTFKSLKTIGIMAYEAVVAGVTDHNPFQKFMNYLTFSVRKKAVNNIAALRAQIPDIFKQVGIDLEIFNGGGTGSIDYALKENVLTEVTVGSGFICSHLFDYYSNLQSHPFEPAIFFALPVVRVSDSNMITCYGGGYVASGACGKDRAPIPWQPQNLELTSDESVGEVQTPLKVKGSVVPLMGGPVLFRPAKGGELAERFNEFLLIRDGHPSGHAKSYRGMGGNFG